MYMYFVVAVSGAMPELGAVRIYMNGASRRGAAPRQIAAAAIFLRPVAAPRPQVIEDHAMCFQRGATQTDLDIILRAPPPFSLPRLLFCRCHVLRLAWRSVGL